MCVPIYIYIYHLKMTILPMDGPIKCSQTDTPPRGKSSLIKTQGTPFLHHLLTQISYYSLLYKDFTGSLNP